MLTFDEAVALLARSFDRLGTETVAIEEAHGRYLAEQITAALDAPRCDVSMMDGYAVAHRAATGNGWLDVTGEARPAMPYAGKLEESQAVRIFTGAPVPRGAGLVIMQEYAERSGDRVRFRDGHGPSSHIRRAGSDFGAGDVLLDSGSRLTPQALVTAAAADRSDLSVTRQPRVAIISTGDELAPPGSAAETAAQIPETASCGVGALAAGAGGQVATLVRVRDDLGQLGKAGACALNDADCVVVIGGASVGDYDFARAMFADQAMELVFSKVAIKPGKPVWLGKVGTKPILGLPGNPTSAMVTARLFLVPLLVALQGGSPEDHLAFLSMQVASPLPEGGDRETFWRAISTPDGIDPIGNQDSGAQAPLAKTDWLVRRPRGAAATLPGDVLPALRFH